ncbi:4-alpha-glucanotransferase [Schaalia vaccimaxillae]|uniref:4-alpha-glucanotransferase n=1 Tax=Schaalia vaccimaxillae TaxID=183916 RepID=UPI0003B50399|nr:4-alpha-glucanotransferase [Schaalia vaccimaxillae]
MDETSPASADIDLLRRLAQLNSVSVDYWDYRGQLQQVAPESLIKVLSALGEDIDLSSTVADLRSAVERAQQRQWRQTIAPTVVVRHGKCCEVPVHVPDGTWVTVSWIGEDGTSGDCAQLDRWVEPQWIDGALVGRATFEVPDHLPLGWHRLVATLEDGRVASAALIVVPDKLTHPSLQNGKRTWGVNAQMYSVRSQSSWGIGDAVDLADLAAVCADRGADFLLINPVHASQPTLPLENSPYLPVTRRWVNPIYIRPESIPEYALLTQDQQAAIEELHRQAVGEPESSDLLDRDRCWKAKRQALEMIFEAGRSYHRDSLFRRFVESGGSDLANFALWSALVESNSTMDLAGLVDNPLGTAADLARSGQAREIEFWKWCQWVASEQLSQAHHVATQVGMSIGIMADLAVGVHPQGSEIWSKPELFAPQMSVGSPPDMYSQQGQNWSQPPWSPRRLAEEGYEPLRDMVRAVLANAGAIRIDHILGLFRLWWIPSGQPASEGTYVYYDHEAMVGVVLLEAQRAGAVVIGEDLGVVEPWVRDYLRERGVLGTAVFWFEKDSAGWPLHPSDYRQACLAAVNIHDLPPTAGYIEGIQTTLRDELGLLVDDVELARASDRLEMEQTEQRLREYGLLTGPNPTPKEIVEALYAYAAKTPAALVVASLVDAVGDRRPQNMPGTHLEYPNWRVPLCDQDGHEVRIEDLSSNERLNSLFSLLSSTLQ